MKDSGCYGCFVSACVIFHQFPNLILIFAVVHNDNDVCMVTTATYTIAIYYNCSYQKLMLIVPSY